MLLSCCLAFLLSSIITMISLGMLISIVVLGVRIHMFVRCFSFALLFCYLYCCHFSDSGKNFSATTLQVTC